MTRTIRLFCQRLKIGYGRISVSMNKFRLRKLEDMEDEESDDKPSKKVKI